MLKPYTPSLSGDRLIQQYHFYSEGFSEALINRWEALVMGDSNETRAVRAFIREVRAYEYIDVSHYPKLNERTISLRAWCGQLVNELLSDTLRLQRSPIPDTGFKSVWLAIQTQTAYITLLFKQLYNEANHCADLLDGDSTKQSSLNYTSKWLHQAMGYALGVYVSEWSAFQDRFKAKYFHWFERCEWLGIAEPSLEDASKFPRPYTMSDLRFVRSSIDPTYFDYKAMNGYYISPNFLFWLDDVFPNAVGRHSSFHVHLDWLARKWR